MRAAIAAAALFILCGCEDATPERLTVVEKPDNIDEVNIDGCQYLRTWVYCGQVIIHKGSCTNSFHLAK